ncbi:hypothetical protein LTR83_009107 [Exophiala xenobiotica]|nr:hypothetical protein LTR93_002288 [Exophiala xenobiotica]KAK5424172.1 hypothetical protein LTR90_001518 [Exophiala xenobiotica]KAK5474452.1 hypothetical protein LTR26_009651 [Exophiala xenobiotica]KAK5483253.1 hypothetical protein LTR83_009107 [Exophiala xenobiotica]KAK5504766.1 hypothetical protein LTR21_009934 [Exophiala xenobiotica]
MLSPLSQEGLDNFKRTSAPRRIPSHTSNSVPRQRRRSSRHWGDHALWVGNIPQNTTVMSLRDYFADAAPSELLTISYNPDAKYAFVNFSTEPARIAAIAKAASELFDGRRLDCRIRGDNASRSTKVSYGLNASDHRGVSISPERHENLWHKVEELYQYPEADPSQRGKVKYFILKSYSLEALYQSLATNLWYIPKRHVERLNHAFQTAGKVYFLFSINGSGEFFGYALMTSEIQMADEATPHAARETRTADASAQQSPVQLRSYTANSRAESRSRAPSTASSDASLGSIHYEPERRRIIWEASHHVSDPQLHVSSPEDSTPDVLSPVTPSESGSPDTRFRNLAMTSGSLAYGSGSPFFTSLANSYGYQSNDNPPGSELQHISNPCQIKWLSTLNLPFDEVRGLKNPWNEGKEVHIARNVTAVESEAGATLLTRWRGKEEARRMKISTEAISKAWPVR